MPHDEARSTMAGRPPEYTIDEAGLAAAEAGALEGLRVGQTLTVVMVAAVAEAATAGDEAAVAPQPATTSGSGGLFLMTEAGAKLCVAPTAAPGGARGARTAPGQAFMVKSIKRSPATGGLVQLQVRLCQAKAPQRPGASAGTGEPGCCRRGTATGQGRPGQLHFWAPVRSRTGSARAHTTCPQHFAKSTAGQGGRAGSRRLWGGQVCHTCPPPTAFRCVRPKGHFNLLPLPLPLCACARASWQHAAWHGGRFQRTAAAAPAGTCRGR